MRRRRDILRNALAKGRPDGLPRCEWFDIGCDFREICGCEKATPLQRVVLASGVRMRDNPEFGSSLAAELAENPEPPRGFRLNDLVFPRKAAFERLPTKDADDHDDSTLEMTLMRLEREGFKGALQQALRFGVQGAFKLVPVSLRSLTGRVSTFRGTPTILRSSKRRELVHRDQLVESFPYYFDRIAFECGLLGQEKGRVVIYYEAFPDEKFMVYDVHFKRLKEILDEAERRLQLLEAGAPPHELPACRPPWMERYCKYAGRCGCGNE
jgi:hypothetical protein